MLQKLLHFIKYNNAFAIGFAIVFLGTSGAFAASPEVRTAAADAIYSQESQVISIDNSYIINKDLSSFMPRVEITNVTEDEEYYYVDYLFYTIDLADGVWQDVAKEQQMKVGKESLEGRDLGIYVTKQLKEVVDGELRRLTETQEIEKSIGESVKQIATAYGGLVGKFVDPTVESLPGYQPVIPEPVVVATPTIAKPVVNTTPSAPQPTVSSTTSGDESDTVPPEIQILGNNPAEVALGSSYVDLGAVVTDNLNNNLGIKAEGENQVDTDTVGDYTITYTATDQAGNTTIATRIVRVYDPNPTPVTPTESATTTATTTQTTPAEPATTTPATTTPTTPVEEPATTTPTTPTEPEPVTTTQDTPAEVTQPTQTDPATTTPETQPTEEQVQETPTEQASTTPTA